MYTMYGLVLRVSKKILQRVNQGGILVSWKSNVSEVGDENIIDNDFHSNIVNCLE